MKYPIYALFALLLFVGTSHAQNDAGPRSTNSSIYEAEQFTKSEHAGIKENASNFSGGQFAYFKPREEAWIEWDQLVIEKAGFYELTIFYAYKRGFLPKASIVVNDRPVNHKIKFSKSESPISLCVYLNKGTNLVRLNLFTLALSSPQIDKLEIASIEESQQALKAAFGAVRNHISGNRTLNAAQFAELKKTIDNTLTVLAAGNPELVEQAFRLVEEYEARYGPMFLNQATKVGRPGWDKRKFQPDVDTTTLAVMQGIVDHAYGRYANISKLRTLIDGFWFRSSEHFPGKVRTQPNPDEVYTVQVDCTFPDTFGREIAFETDPARKPTGAYLAPGSIVAVKFPQSLVGKGYQIRVGAHCGDLWKRPFARRLDRVSIAYPVNQEVMEIANPLGGGIYLEVPYLADAGIQEIKFKNIVRAPYFSMLPHRTTDLEQWQQERAYGAPWADFQTSKIMFQMPTSWVYAVDDPESVMKEWDLAMDSISKLMGFPPVRGKELLYFQWDVMIKGSAGSIGHPQVNLTYSAYEPYEKYQGQNRAFTRGPEGQSMTLHELGHQMGMQKFPGENESVVNLLYAAVLSENYGLNFDEVLRESAYSKKYPYRSLDSTAITWMTSENFKLEKSMVKLEMQYQPKGHARYLEMAQLFGWDSLSKYWRSILEDEEKGIEVDRSVDGLILRLSKAAGVDVTPLIQFWGVQPVNAPQLMAETAKAGLKPSARVYDRLMHFKRLIPENTEAFQEHAVGWWGQQPVDVDPKYVTKAYHEKLFDTYDKSYAATLHQIMQNNIDTYFPEGRP